MNGLLAAYLTAPPAVAFEGLGFSPVKLAMLIIWFYACMFSAQRIEFNRFVPNSLRGLVTILALFLGPLVLLVLLVLEVAQRCADGTTNVMRAIKEALAAKPIKIQNDQLTGSRGQSSVVLIDSSGRSLSEIYSKQKKKSSDVSSAIELTEEMILEAVQDTASDILIDPRDQSTYTVRFRIDGMLREVRQLDRTEAVAVVNSIKAVSGMDIGERRRPQDGAFTAKMPNGTVAFRVATAGVLNGEKLSLRVLDQSVGVLNLSDLGMNTKQFEIVNRMCHQPSGLMLICGPTGSGKTTTLYAMLSTIDSQTRNIISVEDPIEYSLPNISQIEINPRAGITFAKTLRSVLRQDPDVICIGEIRDEETASIAIQASQTGHLVLATMHSSDNISSLVRLLDLGIRPVQLGSALNIVISQRLVRSLCQGCKEPAKLSPEQLQTFRKKGVDTRRISSAIGCEKCAHTGYRGRLGLFDILSMNDKLRKDITEGKLTTSNARSYGQAQGKTNLKKEGLKKVLTGRTTFEEVKRVVASMQ